MKRPAFVLGLVLITLTLSEVASSGASPLIAQPAARPFLQDPLGPLVDVTDRWQAFQPAGHFCVKPDRFELSGSSGPFTTGNNPACRRSGFGPTDKGLYEVTIRAPRLCAGCRRLFIDYSKIPPKNSPPLFYAHGHAYLRLQSINPTYSVDPIAHSPNIKNFTNDKLVAPTGSLQEQIATAIDTYDMAYVGDTKFFVHSQVQGPYYIGPWYVNRSGERITGAYLDLDAMDAVRLPFAVLNLIRYMSGFRSGEPTCPDALFGYTDADAFYGGCVDQMGGSAEAIDPFS